VIVYELACSSGHRFEGWFASAADFERQREERVLVCPLCGIDAVEQVPHAPYVNRGAARTNDGSAPKSSTQYANLGVELLEKLVDAIVEKTEDVGSAFPEEARKIHYREAPERQIRGTATPNEVASLRDEGIDVVAVPIPAHRLGKTH
jgi:hypothetical protein